VIGEPVVKRRRADSGAGFPVVDEDCPDAYVDLVRCAAQAASHDASGGAGLGHAEGSVSLRASSDSESTVTSEDRKAEG